MSSQFKHPLGGKRQSSPQNDEWLTGGAKPAVPGNNQTQGSFAPAGQTPPQAGTGLFMPGTAQNRETPAPARVTEQPTIKQPSFNPNAHNPNSLNGPNSLPQTPGPYVQGQQGRYGPGSGGQMPPFGSPNGPQGPGGAPMFAPPQRTDGSLGSSFSAPGFNAFQQGNPGSSFSMPGGMATVATPPAPGTFQPNRPSWGPGSFNDAAPMAPGRRRIDAPPGKGPGDKRKKKRRVPIWARAVIGLLTFLLVIVGGGGLYYQVNYAGTVNNIVGQQVQRTNQDKGDPNANLSNGILTGPRVNILLLGSDTDQKFQGGYLAQTDIIVTIDPSSKTVGMLSIPRDFYINVPGQGFRKLDEAYYLGGVALSRRTIEQDFGISINYYAWVGLDGFIKVIDTVNGVDVDVMHPIVDDNYPDDTGAHAGDPYAFKRLYLAPGPQHLDGPTALDYVRSRHADLVGDFGRSVRQQQILSALKTKLVNPDIFSKLPDIAKDLNGYVKTDMQLPDILKLMNFARGIDANKINKLTLGPPYSASGTATSGPDSGASVVLPNCDKITSDPAVSQLLGHPMTCNIGYNGDAPPVALGTPTTQPAPLATPSDGSNQPAPLVTPSDGSNQPAPLVTPSDGSNQPAPLVTPDGIQGLGDMAGNATAGLNGGPSDLFGVRSLLDLLCLGVFESPDAFRL